jgi:hypothetical protein
MRKRSAPLSRFAAIPNETVDDAAALDLTALGLLTVLVRHQDGWDITLEKIGREYGYGKDAMANAMGLLQVACYVVKIRVQDAATKQWRTEMVVGVSPMSEADVSDMLNDISLEPDTYDVQLIAPTATALKRAESRKQKLNQGRKTAGRSRQSEIPHSGGRPGPKPTTGNPALGSDLEEGAFPQVGPECGSTDCRQTRSHKEDCPRRGPSRAREKTLSPKKTAREANRRSLGDGSSERDQASPTTNNPGESDVTAMRTSIDQVIRSYQGAAQRAGRRLPGATVEDVRQQASRILGEGLSKERTDHLVTLVADMAARGWCDLEQHLLKNPFPGQRGPSGVPPWCGQCGDAAIVRSDYHPSTHIALRMTGPEYLTKCPECWPRATSASA